MRQKQTFRRTTLILGFLGGLLIGLFYAKFTTPLALVWCLAAVCLFVFLPRKDIIALAALVIFGFMFGWWRGGLLQAQMVTYETHFFKNVTVIGKATEDGVYNDDSQLEFTVEQVKINGQAAPGKVKISGFGQASVNRHDIISARGKLYPTLGGKQASMRFAEIDTIAAATGPVETFRKRFTAGMETALPEPAASFGVGLLVGQRSLLPDDVALALTAAGLTHIVAVSGYNLTIIIRAVSRSLKRLSRFQILISCYTLIYLFILVTGFSPSIVRAGMVAALSLLAWYFGRNLRPILLLGFVAAVTAFVNPFYVWSDIGWYLSFLAFFGVLIVAPLALLRWTGKTTEQSPLLLGIVSESFAAQILTLPLIMLIFARFSLVGLLANIIIVPMVPFAMLFSLIAGLAGVFVPEISGWFALPARILLDTMLWLADWFASWPNATLAVSIGWLGLLAMYAAILAIVLGLKRKVQSVTIKS